MNFKRFCGISHTALSVICSRHKIEDCVRHLHRIPHTCYIFYRSSEDLRHLLDLCREIHLSCAVWYKTMPEKEKIDVARNFTANRFQILLNHMDYLFPLTKTAAPSVICYDVPDSLRHYYQMLRYLGSDSRSKHGLILYEPANMQTCIQRIHREFPVENSVRVVFEALQVYTRQEPVRSVRAVKQVHIKQILTDIGGLYLSGLMRVLNELHRQKIIQCVSLTNQSVRYTMFKQSLKHFDVSGLERIHTQKLREVETVFDYLYSSECRRQLLQQELFHHHQVPCGICDNCQQQKIEFTREKYHPGLFRDILHCLLETREKFGRSVIINILRGRRNKTISHYKLERCTLFGKWRDLDAQSMQSALYQMMDDGFVTTRQGLYPTLTVTPAGREQLGERHVAALSLPKHIDEDADFDAVLFEEFRTLRTKIAEQHNVPTFMILRDKVLQDLCRYLPETREALLAIRGIGKVTWNLCGQELLQTVHRYRKQHGGQHTA